MEPEYLILSVSDRSRILIFKIFDRAGLDLESYSVQLELDLKENACLIFAT